MYEFYHIEKNIATKNRLQIKFIAVCFNIMLSDEPCYIRL